ncbi:conserved Plasmodium protein, unknown function [Babesia microti strain RI]|uniref:BIR protein n=1 Tax=Babesia microti (strain RI) TaxID=1133968 RepID=A0A1N6LXC2_BABMR|nr:conserved Plasmodium protein, unknown function [Babesia microti strain RI]SIO73529.1 conserved Plasmodium protein, unknown function [Babesia microti strain RI]|eukprot:XP_021337621.1 conserved Plasmodium protein, unknown function [Babesia microti strain RI]
MSTCRYLPLNRRIRELPWKSRFEILNNPVKPRYMNECVGTPRREYQENVVNGIRVAPTFNPYVELNRDKRYRLDHWPSRNWDDWDPRHCFVRGGRRRYQIPRAIAATRDELGHAHPPRLSGRYKADVEKQYYYHGLPWVWKDNFYTKNLHSHDRPVLGPKIWYRNEFRKKQIEKALERTDTVTEEYKKERYSAKRLTYFEKVVNDMAGEEIASKYVRKPIVPKID